MGNKNLVPLNDGRGAEFMSEEAQSVTSRASVRFSSRYLVLGRDDRNN